MPRSKVQTNIQGTKEFAMKSILITLLILPAMSFAQMTAKDGQKKLVDNVENSKANIAEYEKNLKIVEDNIVEVNKSMTQVSDQAKQVKNTIAENNKSILALEKRDKEINASVLKEKNESAADQAKIVELEKLITALKSNIEKRQKNVEMYAEQQKIISEDLKTWKARGEELNKQNASVNDRMNKVKKEQAEWSGKKRGYEGEISRWKKELDKHEKALKDFNTLSSVKD